MNCFFSSTVAQIQQTMLTAEIFLAKLMDLSAAANGVYQSPMNMPNTQVKTSKQVPKIVKDSTERMFAR